MAAGNITVNDRAFQRAIKKAARRNANMRPLWEDIGEEALQIVQENFAAEGRPVKWETWSLAYKKKRRKKVASDEAMLEEKILTLSGRLRHSVTKGKPEYGQHVILEPKQTGVVIGTNVEYAAAHNFGWPKGGLPKREFLVIPDSEIPRLTAIVEEYITEPFDG